NGPRLRVFVSIGIGAALLYFVATRIDLGRTWDAIAGGRVWYVAAGVTLMVCAYLVRGARWLIWDRSRTYTASLKAIFVGFMGNNVLPARLGEFLRADWTAARSTDDLGRTAALAAIAAERILDGLVLSGLAVVGLAFVNVDRNIFAGLLVVIAAFSVLTVALAFAVFRDTSLRRTLTWLNRT